MAVRVYFEDTDAGGVVYYANYLRFCERARTEWLRAKGFGQQALIDESGIAFVVRRFTADYLGSARLDDELEVVTSIERIGGASIDFVQAIVRGQVRLFTSRVTVACIDLARHAATAIPGPIRRRLSSPN
ncbi:MAG: tol-pal system-associated acyl-CoA thioesterase [Rhodocyclaceae bacterium]|nr:tol-pal system-associated acyl-CoA thioesterase [Rhodocyclaceae bacterium]